VTFYGPITYVFNYADPRTIRVTCTDERRPSFVDVARGEEEQRLEVKAGDTIELELAPGSVTIAFGACIRAEVEA
jgi:hypothetical protein